MNTVACVMSLFRKFVHGIVEGAGGLPIIVSHHGTINMSWTGLYHGVSDRSLEHGDHACAVSEDVVCMNERGRRGDVRSLTGYHS